ncbi:MAG: pentapeptide repeat-containing protein [Chloroflexi bacterium]|nr:pentapeptide repeat-containing protein [Chloroflexota bacterium]
MSRVKALTPGRVIEHRGWLPWALGILAVAIAIGLALWLIPGSQVPSGVTDAMEKAKLEDQFRRTLAQIIAGVVILAGVYVAWRRASAVEKTVEVSREGQITERFTRAIEQLGSDNIAICLGGIYALERIAKDSPKNDHRQVMEVLTAYVRENARWDEAKAASEEPDQEHRPSITIQAILTVLGRRDRGHEDEDFHLDLSGTDLRGADLKEAQLQRVNFNNVHMEGADLFRADLAWADLEYAYLERANFREAHLEQANLFQAFMEGANLYAAHLEHVSLIATDLRGATLTKAHLEGAQAYEAHLEEASLNDAYLQGADFADAHLEGARLKDAHLERTDWRGVSGLAKEQIESAHIDEETVLPDYLREEGETQE